MFYELRTQLNDKYDIWVVSMFAQLLLWYVVVCMRYVYCIVLLSDYHV